MHNTNAQGGGGGEGKPADYRNIILYVVPGEVNSEKALACVAANQELASEIWVQDVRLLQPPLPAWLTGVPTAVLREEGVPHRGSNCLAFLEQQSNGPQSFRQLPAGVCQSGCQSFDDGKPLMTMYESADIDVTQPAFDLGDGKVDASTVDQYMALRSQQDQKFNVPEESTQQLVQTQ